MAGILSMIPGLISGAKSSGILDTLKNAAGSVLSDLGSGRVSSWADFGKSLARSGAKALGAEVPEHDQKVSSSIAATKAVLDHGNNAANERTMIQTADQPKAKMFTPYMKLAEENVTVPIAAPMQHLHQEDYHEKPMKKMKKIHKGKKSRSLYKKKK